MKVNIRLVFNRYKKLNKNGEAPIYIEVSFNRDKRKPINTKIHIAPNQWNDKKKEINNKYSAYIETNLYIRKMVDEILQYEASLLNSGKILTPNLLDDLIKGKKDNTKLFYKFVQDEFNKENLAIGTYKKNKAIINKLERHSPELTFSEVDYNYIKEIDTWLSNQASITSINTIANYHKIIKKYISLAINTGLMKYENNPYNKFKIKKTATTRINLSEKQLNKFENCEIESSYIQKIKDMFVFSCYTGLRYSDIVNLKPEHFEINDEEVIIKIGKMIKTQRPVTLPLNTLFDGKPLVIFNKYYKKDMRFLFGEPISNQHINRELKFIARTAKITYKDLTFHMARHTFGSLLAEKTGDPYLIKDLMGHSDIKMSMEYIHSSEKGRNERLKKINW